MAWYLVKHRDNFEFTFYNLQKKWEFKTKTNEQIISFDLEVRCSMYDLT